MLEIGSGPSGPVYIDVKRDGYPLLLVSPRKLQQLYQALGRYPMNNAQRLLPPHSIESEQSVLGGLMLDNDRWDDIATIVSADNFYVRPHQLIFNAMHDLLMQGSPSI